MGAGKLLSAKRRDDRAGKQCGVIGWETVETRQGGGGEHQRMIWQCYDVQNNYMNFNATCHPDRFEASKAELQGILDSIKFCK